MGKHRLASGTPVPLRRDLALSGRLRHCEEDAKALVIGSAQIEVARWHFMGPAVDPRDDYARRYWLPIIGPTCFLLAQTLSDTLRSVSEECHPVAVPTVQLAEAVGIGGSLGPHAPLVRSVARLVLFELATPMGTVLFARDKWPPLTHGQHRRLPEWLAVQHRQDLIHMQSADSQVALADERSRA